MIAFGLRALNGAAEKVAIRDTTRIADQVNDRALAESDTADVYGRRRRRVLPGTQDLLTRAAEAVKAYQREAAATLDAAWKGGGADRGEG